MRADRPQGTKLLVATLGLATVSYVGCGNSHPPGNLMQSPDPTETASNGPDDHPPGNLMAPPGMPTTTPSASATTTATAVDDPDMPHGNLMAPPPPPKKK
jgi:hypothetical protein